MLKEKNETMKTLISLVRKEAIHIIRDTRTAVIVIVMPLILLLLFGFAVSTEVNNVRVVAVVSQITPDTDRIIERMNTNSYFSFDGLVAASEVEPLLRSGKTDAALFLRSPKGSLEAQIIVDASNPTNARSMSAYIQGILAEAAPESDVIITRTLYNPEMKSAYNFVPGIMGMIFILVCAIMTSVSIVREKESGTMDLLLVSPVRPATIVLGKLIPYFILSCLLLTVMLVVSFTLLGLPVSSSLPDVIILSVIYIILSLSIGLLVSTLASTQLTALIVSAVGFMIPVIMFSGMIFPIDNMPLPLQWFSCIIPARWYTAAMRKLMVQELSLVYVAKELVILAGITLLVLTVAIKKFSSSK